MSGPLTPASAVTSGNLAAGFVALVLAQQGEYVWAAGLVGVAALCDAVDGVVARLTRSNCEVGSQLDSLADLVSFGVAPAFIIYLSTLHSLPVAGIGACLGFVLCGAWRLARFQTEAESRIRFIGLPIPPAGVITVVLALLDPMPGLPLVVVAVLSLLMVSRVPFPTFSELRQVAFPPKRPHAAEPVQGNRE